LEHSTCAVCVRPHERAHADDSLVAEPGEGNEADLMIVLPESCSLRFDAGNAELDQLFTFMVAIHGSFSLEDVMAMTGER